MSARLIMRDEPGAWITFTSGRDTYRARLDPLWLGADGLQDLARNTKLVWQLLDDSSRLMAMMSDMFAARTLVLLRDYLDAAGLGFEGFHRLLYAIEHLDELEIDLLRLGFDVRDWLNPDGPLSSRRVALIVKDCLHRPETQLGAVRENKHPISKDAIVLAQIAGGMSESKEPHLYLRSPEQLEAEAKAAREEREKIERIKARGF